MAGFKLRGRYPLTTLMLYGGKVTQFRVTSLTAFIAAGAPVAAMATAYWAMAAFDEGEEGLHEYL